MTKDKTIFIKNIYYMLAYAFYDLHQSCMTEISVEQFENIHDLFAAILEKGIGLQLKRGLHREYISQQENLSVMRGKINLNETIKKQVSRQNLLTCEFDDFSENNIYNQILKTTVSVLLHHGNVKSERKALLKKEMLFFSGIDEIEPRMIHWDQIHFERNNQTYQLLLGICRLVLNGLLLTTEQGTHKLASFEGYIIHHLYEKFILSYYRKEHPELHVGAEQIPWALDDPGSKEMLPVMQTDIMLSKGNKILIIDAKYYSHTLQTQYDKHTIHSHNLYQIFTYVKNKDAEFKNSPHEVAGLLLYAKTDEAIQPDNSYKMSGNQIQIRTLDLNCEFSAISSRLDYLANVFFEHRSVPPDGR